jgi:hypothetical protein
MCNHYAQTIIKSLKKAGIEPTVENVYMGWNQGPSGVVTIWKSIKTGQPVTDPEVLKGMRNQGPGIPFSSDGRTFYNNTKHFIETTGIKLS